MGKNRLLSRIISMILVIALLPVSAFAEFLPDSTAAPLPTLVDSGTCGENLTWTLTEDGTLTISGEGAMEDYSQWGDYNAPWEIYSDSVICAVINSGVTSIGDWAFAGCGKLASIDIPDGLTTIGVGAFASCRSLAEIVIPDSVDTIAYWAFTYCSALTDVSLPYYLTYIDEHCFSGCTSLTRIEIPANVTTIYEGAFYDCDSLAEVIFKGSQKQWDSIEIDTGNDELLNAEIKFPEIVNSGTCGDALLWTLDEYGTLTISGEGWMDYYYPRTTIPWYNDRASVVSLVIEDGVINISDFAFAQCSNLIHVSIADSVEEFGGSVFSSCTSLERITLPKNLTYIFSSMFKFCTALKQVTIPESVVEIYPAAFVGCDALETIIFTGGPVAWDCMAVGEYNEPLQNATVACTGIDVFYGSCGDSVTWYLSEEGVLAINGSGWMQYDGAYAPWYRYRTLITDAVISDGVRAIANAAFANCTALESISIPASVTYISYNAFEGCTALESITLPEGLTTIYGRTFSNCTALKHVTIPGSVTEIGYGAFSGCDALETVTFTGGALAWQGVVIEEENEPLTNATVTFTGEDQFEGTCGKNLTWKLENGTLTISGTGQMDDFVLDSIPWSYYRDMITTLIVEEGVTSLASEAFDGYTALTSVSLPASLLATGSRCFQDCTALESIVLPEGLTELSTQLFVGCTALKHVTIPGSVMKISSGAFQGCTALETVTFTGGALAWQGVVIGANNESLTNATVTCTGEDLFEGACGDAATWKLKNGILTISGEGKMRFGNYAPWFVYRSLVTTVIVDDGITYIDSSAFSGCSLLTDVSLPAGVTGMGGSVFENCTALETITLPEGLTFINGMMFKGCTALRHVTIPGSVEEIVSRVFHDCTALETVTYTGNELEWSLVEIDEGNEPLLSAAVTCTGSDVVEGSCGETVTWKLENGTLTISGEGQMAQYSSYSMPWYRYVPAITAVVVENGVTVIARGTFYCHTALTDVSLPTSVTELGSSAFAGCTALEIITLPEGLATIPSYLFEDCTALRHVTIPGSVTEIGYGAFISCDTLKTVTFTGTVDAWNEVTIRGGNTALTNAAITFSGSELSGNLCGEKVTWTLENGVLTISGEGQMYAYNDKDQLPWYESRYDITEVIIENGVTNICDYAFDGYVYLAQITIPGSVTTIGRSAFESCWALTAVEIPYGVTEIDRYAFCDCEGLASITLSDSVTTIGFGAFQDCGNLKSFEIPAGVTSIAHQVFTDCTRLAYITVDENNTVYSSIDGVLLSKDQKTLVLYPEGKTDLEYTVPDGVTHIGDSAFYGCTQPVSVILPDSVTHIGDDAFMWCSGITNLHLGGGVTHIGAYAFSMCTGLASIFIPDSVVNIGSNAFFGCERLAAISAGSGNSVYSSMDGILFSEDQTTLVLYPAGKTSPTYTIGDHVTQIGEHAFSGCIHLRSITIPDNVATIGKYAFSNCVSLERIILPVGITDIGESAFSGCSGLMGIAIPEGITSLGKFAFYGCTRLKVVVIPGSITNINQSAFYGCSALKSVYYTGSSDQWRDISIEDGNSCLKDAEIYFGATGNELDTALYPEIIDSGSCGYGITWQVTDDGALTIIGEGAMDDYTGLSRVPWYTYRSRITKLVIKEGVTYISQSAFKDCENLRFAEIPDSVTTIGAEAFYGCEVLAAVELPDRVTTIGDRAFFYCAGLLDLTIPDSVTTIGAGAFCLCESLTGVTIPHSVTSIGADAFGRCFSLLEIIVDKNNTMYSSIDGVLFSKDQTILIRYPIAKPGHTFIIPEGVTTIADDAFCNCERLTELELPIGTAEIGASAFAYCTRLANILIPHSVTSIGEMAFRSCSLTSIEIPNRVTTIGDFTFDDCTSLESVTIPVSVTEISDYAFSDCPGLQTVYYTGSASQWTDVTVGSDNEFLTNADFVFNWVVPHAWREATYTWLENYTKCTADHTCKKGCGTDDSETVTAVIVVTAPTCTEDGYITHTATFTKEGFETQQQVFEGESATGHTEEDIPYKAPTCTEDGIQSGKKCVTCGVITEMEAIPALGHTEEIIPGKDPTFTEPGLTNGKRCTVCGVTTVSQKVIPALESASGTCGKNLTWKLTEDGTLTISGKGSMNDYSIEDGNLAPWSEYYMFITSVVIKDGVTSIGSAAFVVHVSLTSVSIPFSMASIGREAFGSCYSLTDVYYQGDAHHWNEIEIGADNLCLVEAAMHFNLPRQPIKKSGEFSWSTDFASGQNWTYTYDYDESWFLTDSSVYQHDLVQMSIRLAMAAYGANDGVNTYTEKNIKALLEDLEFTNQEYHYPKPKYDIVGSSDTIGYAIASKNIVAEDREPFTLIVVAVRGGYYGVEWGPNFRIGLGTEHEGFLDARDLVLQGLDQYIETYGDDLLDNCKIWLTGYSRAAATANLVAKSLIDGYLDDVTLDSNDLYTFCFECPQNSRSSSTSSSRYKNIVNIVNPIDFVTKVAMSKWKYSRFGTTLYLPYALGNNNYNDLRVGMLTQYIYIGRYNGENAILDRIGTDDPLQSVMLDKFMDALALSAYVTAENYVRVGGQARFIDIAAKALGRDGFDGYAFVESILSVPAVLRLGVTSPFVTGYVISMALMNNFTTAHYAELCLAWLDSLDGDLSKFASSKYRQVFVNCPVNVTVTDSNGQIVAQIIDDVVQEIEGGLPTYIDDSGQKVIAIPCDGEYTVSMEATDDGSVTYTVTEYNIDTSANEKVVGYYELEIEQGDELEGIIDDLTENEDAQYELSLNGDEVEASVRQTGEEVITHTVTINVSGSGSVYGDTVYTNGEFAKIIAVADEGYVFSGWYIEDQLVSTETEYRFLVDSDIVFTAVFTSLTPLIGDVNGDSILNVYDAIDLLSIIANGECDPALFTVCDVNGDGIINVYDAIDLLSIIANQTA